VIEAVLKLTVPGVPDIYQGAEFWEQSLVDPDNRRPVDFERRRQSLADGCTETDLTVNWRTGRIKQWVLQRLLQLRAQHSELFRDGDYTPLPVEYSDRSVVAFKRSWEGKSLLVCVRLYPWRSRPWEEATVVIPSAAWKCALGDIKQEQGKARVCFDRVPFAIGIGET
jgi:(1->4)-alpha-D-glucan 1-alpha-D-glucosylmutase